VRAEVEITETLLGVVTNVYVLTVPVEIRGTADTTGNVGRVTERNYGQVRMIESAVSDVVHVKIEMTRLT